MDIEVIVVAVEIFFGVLLLLPPKIFLVTLLIVLK